MCMEHVDVILLHIPDPGPLSHQYHMSQTISAIKTPRYYDLKHILHHIKIAGGLTEDNYDFLFLNFTMAIMFNVVVHIT